MFESIDLSELIVNTQLDNRAYFIALMRIATNVPRDASGCCFYCGNQDTKLSGGFVRTEWHRPECPVFIASKALFDHPLRAIYHPVRKSPELELSEILDLYRQGKIANADEYLRKASDMLVKFIDGCTAIEFQKILDIVKAIEVELLPEVIIDIGHTSNSTIRQLVNELILSYLLSDNSRLRYAALRSISVISDSFFIESVSSLVDSETDAIVRHLASHVLAYLEGRLGKNKPR